jgi:hypothetical protein
MVYCIQEAGILAGLEVLTAMAMKCSLFWVITACTPLKVSRCRLHLQGKRISQA